MTLAKFVVGCKLTVEEADELFVLIGHALDKRNRFDYILACELIHGCDILEFDKDLRTYNDKGILNVD
ncbi:hypothetical protein SAMN05421730_10201 [Anaerobium acetethylicum]|uniref:Uncharacterized protein n=2 Tax=Anaerobium acetethylicum TaxID=1619234 RepID=A0A1D3TW09_9FIRM|nr:hypothetical protein SAMN05421730_10201 [Anaerobium acetethylicum]